MRTYDTISLHYHDRDERNGWFVREVSLNQMKLTYPFVSPYATVVAHKETYPVVLRHDPYFNWLLFGEDAGFHRWLQSYNLFDALEQEYPLAFGTAQPFEVDEHGERMITPHELISPIMEARLELARRLIVDFDAPAPDWMLTLLRDRNGSIWNAYTITYYCARSKL